MVKYHINPEIIVVLLTQWPYHLPVLQLLTLKQNRFLHHRYPQTPHQQYLVKNYWSILIYTIKSIWYKIDYDYDNNDNNDNVDDINNNINTNDNDGNNNDDVTTIILLVSCWTLFLYICVNKVRY